MKNILKKGAIWTLLFGVLIAYSCKEGFLDIPVTGQVDQEQLSSKIGLEAALIAAYSQVNGRAGRMASPSNWVWGSIRGAEANKGTDPGDFSDINPIMIYEPQSTQGVINEKYSGNYEGVARCNNVLKRLKTAAADVTADQKLALEAQTKFLRAHFYFEMKRTFNDVPYVDENVDYETGIEKVKNDVDLWPKIEADMQFAYDNLPETQGQVGRVNKWAAGAYLAKIYMYQKKYDAAKALYDVIIVSGKTSNGKAYGLVPKYADVFKATNDNHEESIWAYQAAANTGSVNNANPEFDLNWPYNTGADGPGNCCSFFQPTFEHANSFLTSGGLPLLDRSFTATTKELFSDMGVESSAVWKADTKYKKDQWASAYDPAKPKQERVYKSLVGDDASPNTGNNPLTSPTQWELKWVESTNKDFADVELDPRIDHSLGRRGIPYLDWMDFPGKAWIRNQPNAGPYQTKKFVYYKDEKGKTQDNSSWTPGYTAVNFAIIRFADVLLMAAEAEIEVGDPMKAREYVNRIRARAANSDGWVKDGVGTGTVTNAANYVINQYTDVWAKDDATRNKVRFERRLELSGEGHRFFDLVRWGTAKTELDAYLSYEAPKLPLGPLTGAKFDLGKDELLPIPQNQIDLLGTDVIKQNPGF
jgi:starch-binding outer membrane protein, SusD/RagB family